MRKKDKMINEKDTTLLEKELIESLTTYRSQFTLLTQIVTVIIVANATIVGIAFTSKKPEVFYLASLMPVLILFVRVKSQQLMIPIAYVAYYIEKQLCKSSIDLLMTTYLTVISESTLKEFDKIRKNTESKERMKLLKEKITSPTYLMFGDSNLFVTVLCILATILQIWIPYKFYCEIKC